MQRRAMKVLLPACWGVPVTVAPTSHSCLPPMSAKPLASPGVGGVTRLNACPLECITNAESVSFCLGKKPAAQMLVLDFTTTASSELIAGDGADTALQVWPS